MTLDDLVVRYSYDAWANEKLFGVVSRLSPEEFTRSITGGWASIRTTLVHIVSAEWGWVSRCGGKPDRGPRLDPANYPTPAAIISESRRVDGYARAFLSTLVDEDLSRDVDYSFDPGTQRFLPLGALLHHAATHSVHHRGQVASMLRLLGHTPGNFDMLFYFAEKSGVAA